MPSLSNTALLLELNIFSVDNNIRRGVLAVAANIQATDAEILESSKKLSPGQSWTFNSLANNKGTIVRVQGGSADLVVAQSPTPWSMKVKSVFVCTDSVGNLTFTNPVSATSDILVRVLQA